MYLLCKFAALLMVSQIADGAAVATVNDTAATRLKFMQVSGAGYSVSVNRGGTTIDATFQRKPVLRFTNPVSGVVDGGLFVWTDDQERPVAAAQFFIIPNTDDVWLHEFQSLSTDPMQFLYDGKKAWTPSKPGVTFQADTNSGAPAASPVARLRQMRQLARRFSVKDGFEGAEADQLRLMSTPLVRYNDEQAIDGAVFVFAHGTDPELFVIIEARHTSSDANEQPSWHVALAPMTSYAIAAQLDQRDYWSIPWRRPPYPLSATFRNFVFPPK